MCHLWHTFNLYISHLSWMCIETNIKNKWNIFWKRQNIRWKEWKRCYCEISIWFFRWYKNNYELLSRCFRQNAKINQCRKSSWFTLPINHRSHTPDLLLFVECYYIHKMILEYIEAYKVEWRNCLKQLGRLSGCYLLDFYFKRFWGLY